MGNGIFETIKTVHGRPQYLNEHLQRARVGARKMKIKIEPEDAIIKRIVEFLDSHTVPTPLGRLRVEFLIAGEMRLSHSEYETWTSPARLTITGLRVDERAKSAGIKALPYFENLDLLIRAKEAGFDEVIRFNSRNLICEGATSNLLFKISGKWVTPDLASGCLPGIIRALCFDWFSISERPILRDELADIESAFILSSLRGVQPASCIGPHELLVDESMESLAKARMHAHSVE